MSSGSPVLRIALGLVLVTTSILMMLDMVGVFPSQGAERIESRMQLVETLASQVGAAGSKNMASIRPALQVAVSKNDDVLSVGLRDPSGRVLMAAGDHTMFWETDEEARDKATHVDVPLFSGGKPWAKVEVRFAEMQAGGLIETIWQRPLFRVMVLMGIFGFFGYLFYLKRTLRHLDPSSVVPARVQAALDVMAEGVLLLDQREHIVLANSAFTERTGRAGRELVGSVVSKLPWRRPDAPGPNPPLPWRSSIEDGETVQATLFLENAYSEQHSFIVKSSPVLDGWDRPKGAIVTFDDVTELERKTAELEETLAVLEKSQEEITRQNEELEFLAHHDPLTGASNRRFFLERFDDDFANAEREGKSVACVMADIDLFKRINDEHGHQTGDEVIRRVSEALMTEVRTADNVCRYGGEEFCLILQDTTVEGAEAAAERLRARIDSPGFARVPVSVSFGVSATAFGASTLHDLIDQADQCLYVSKNTGRNRVTRWDLREQASNGGES